jgi:PAS domain S-box-containing protein
MTQNKKIRVLVIDDDPEDAMILQRHLSVCDKYSVETEHSQDLEQALEKLGKSPFDLIFLDNKLGSGITARDIVKDLQKKKISTPIIIFTGTGDQKTAVELMKMGVYDYIVKDGCAAEVLEKTMHSTLERHTLKNKQQQSEAQIRQQKELLADVISNIPYFIFWKDRSSVYLGCNEKFAEIAGVHSPEQIVGKTDYELGWAEKQADFFIKFDKEVIESGNPLLDLEAIFVREDGKEAVFSTSKVPLKDFCGNVIGLLGICTDITERK